MKQSKKLHTELVSEIKTILPDVRCVYLFGSFASGDVTTQSDIDIAVLAESKIDAISRWNIQSELAQKLNREVDLVDLLSASTVMQFQIVRSGICLFQRDQAAAKFEMQVISMYQHLSAERSEIITSVMGTK